jgi:ribulose-phosphate 3-epimerase
MHPNITVAPSLLAADWSCLKDEIHALEKTGVSMLHFDIMDGHFVPNISFGATMIKTLRPLTKMVFDVHLMISPVDTLLDSFIEAGSDIITLHPEACFHPMRSLMHIKEKGKKAGIALNPGTSAACLEPYMHLVDLILVMTVNPGFGGQSFIEDMLPKIQHVKKMIEKTNRPIKLEVDGGINEKTAPLVLEAGACTLVVGTALFKNKPQDYGLILEKLCK